MKKVEPKELEELICKFVTENAKGVEGSDGTYYHQIDVCALLKSYHEKELEKLLSQHKGKVA